MKTMFYQKGVGLIEVMITVLLLSTSLLALSSLQARSLMFNNSAYVRSQANIFAYDIIDRIRISKSISPQSFNIGFEDALPTGTEQQSIEVKQWRTNLSNSIPGAKGQIACDANRFCTVQIRWGEQSSSGDNADDESTFLYTVKL